VSTPDGQDADGPNIARVYYYLLGGSHNCAADRAAADEVLARWPDVPETMRLNRAFLGRAVHFLAAKAGIRQFLDIDSARLQRISTSARPCRRPQGRLRRNQPAS
jgi:hypothetical protein